MEPRKLTILVVDDEPPMRHLVRRALENCGYTVLEAETGAAAIDIARDQPIDALVTDVVMPGMSGLELVTVLHASGAVRRFLVMSGMSAAEAVAGLPCPATFLSKPVEPEAVAGVVRNLLALEG